ncbi:hypothetical protein M378DRAFT_59353, partial [Amanita muscaria Koide BX008]
DLSNLGCATRSDGTLKDASEIEWHFDKDDETPMLTDTLAVTSSDSPTTTPVIHPLFSGCVAPAAFVAGSRRSTRTSCPSARVADPENAMAVSRPSTSAG